MRSGHAPYTTLRPLHTLGSPFSDKIRRIPPHTPSFTHFFGFRVLKSPKHCIHEPSSRVVVVYTQYTQWDFENLHLSREKVVFDTLPWIFRHIINGGWGGGGGSTRCSAGVEHVPVQILLECGFFTENKKNISLKNGGFT